MTGSPDHDAVYDRIYRAVLEQRLVPGTKLAEQKLAGIFGVSRGRIREVLARLEYDGIVEQIPNRGSYIARPTEQESGDVLDARRLIESVLVRRLAASHAPADLDRLRAHVAAEWAAQRADDEGAAIRLSGEFHNLVADLVPNARLSRIVRQLSALTCLAILIHRAPTASACRPAEHASIVDLIAEGDAGGAAASMVGHLDEVDRSLDIAPPSAAVDLADILAASSGEHS